MKFQFLFFGILLFLFSCEEDDITPNDKAANYSPEIRFDNLEWIFQGRNITCMDFDTYGNAWIASGTDLIFYDGVDTQLYNAQSVIIDLAVAPNGTVWLGTKDKGLARFKGRSFNWYTENNSIIPRNYIHSLGVDSNNKVWFCSAAHDLGGVMSYDGRRFKLFSPENSLLNQHVIQNMKIDNNNNVYFHTQGTVGNTAVFKISNSGKWEQLGDHDASFYWLMSLDVTSDGKVFITTDHSLSSCFGCYTDEILYCESGNWKTLLTPFELGFISLMFLDKRDYVWITHHRPNNYFSFYVFDGKEWHRSEEGQIPEFYYNDVKTDSKNNIWFCTRNGIFILKQE